MTSAPPAGRRPNILFLLSDDHAAHAISAYGSVVNTTPAHRRDRRGRRPVRQPLRDELALRAEPGVPADRHLQPRQRREHPRHVHRRHASPPSSRRCGTRATAPASSASGTWATARPTGSATTRTGFDYWDALIDQGEYHDPRFLSADGLRVEPGYATDLITDLAIRWLGSLDGGRAVVPPGLAQGPAPALGTGRRAYRACMRTAEIPVPGTFTDDLATRSDTARRAAMSVADDLTEVDLKQPVPQGLSREDEALWKYQRYMEDYLACVASVDDNVGRLVGWLRDRGDLDDTVLLYGSDQGFFLGDHGWFDKRFMYEESIRMPFLVSYPRAVAAGDDAYRHRQQRRRRPDPARGGGRTRRPPDAGPLVLARRRRNPRPRPAARRAVLPLLDARRPQPPRRRALRLPHRPVLPRLLLQRRPRRARLLRRALPGRVGALRPARGPRRAPQRRRRPGVRVGADRPRAPALARAGLGGRRPASGAAADPPTSEESRFL